MKTNIYGIIVLMQTFMLLTADDAASAGYAARRTAVRTAAVAFIYRPIFDLFSSDLSLCSIH